MRVILAVAESCLLKVPRYLKTQKNMSHHSESSDPHYASKPQTPQEDRATTPKHAKSTEHQAFPQHPKNNTLEKKQQTSYPTLKERIHIVFPFSGRIECHMALKKTKTQK